MTFEEKCLLMDTLFLQQIEIETAKRNNEERLREVWISFTPGEQNQHHQRSLNPTATLTFKNGAWMAEEK